MFGTFRATQISRKERLWVTSKFSKKFRMKFLIAQYYWRCRNHPHPHKIRKLRPKLRPRRIWTARIQKYCKSVEKRKLRPWSEFPPRQTQTMVRVNCQIGDGGGSWVGDSINFNVVFWQVASLCQMVATKLLQESLWQQPWKHGKDATETSRWPKVKSNLTHSKAGKMSSTSWVAKLKGKINMQDARESVSVILIHSLGVQICICILNLFSKNENLHVIRFGGDGSH